MYKKVNVVMLPTNEKATAPIFKSNNHLYMGYGEKLEYKNKDNSYQHLFITSDEEIKEGDYTIYCSIWLCKILKHYGDQVLVVKVRDNTQIIVLIPEHKKIIATTDKNLVTKYDERFEDVTINKNSLNQKLPQPSQSFIEKYVEEYNKGNLITEVMVEYNEKGIIQRGRGGERTITICKIKDSWSRQEVESLIREWASFTVTGRGQWWKPNDLDNWIKENL